MALRKIAYKCAPPSPSFGKYVLNYMLIIFEICRSYERRSSRNNKIFLFSVIRGKICNCRSQIFLSVFDPGASARKFDLFEASRFWSSKNRLENLQFLFWLAFRLSTSRSIEENPIEKFRVAFLNAIFITMPMVFSCAISGSIISHSPGKTRRAQPVPLPNRHYSPRFGRVSSLTVEAPETRLRQRLHAGLFPFPLTLTEPSLQFQESRL